jgi:very-short-patch-repair endonuclease
MSLPYSGKLISRAKELRKNMTSQEKKLWYQFLNKYTIRFQRQKTIDSFIADFYCAKAKLAVEIDGSQHFTEEGLVYDNERSLILSKHGVDIIRFSNYDIDRNFVEVCRLIDYQVQKRIFEGAPYGKP